MLRVPFSLKINKKVGVGIPFDCSFDSLRLIVVLRFITLTLLPSQ